MSKHSPSLPEATVSNKAFQTKSIIAFLIFIALISAGWATFKWINRQPKVAGALKPLRKTLDLNEKVFSGIFDTNHLVKEYPISQAVKRVRVNGMYGLRDSVNEETW